VFLKVNQTGAFSTLLLLEIMQMEILQTKKRSILFFLCKNAWYGTFL